MIGYHFTGNKLRDGRPIPKVGEWLIHQGPIEPCKSGLHMSEHPFDAMQYAPGNILHKVELVDDLVPHGDPIDKWVGRRRRIIASFDAEKTLRKFACDCALSVIHRWNAPDVVTEYLKTQDETLRTAACNAARTAAWDAACNAAWAAAWDATRNAARTNETKQLRDKFKKMVDAKFGVGLKT